LPSTRHAKATFPVANSEGDSRLPTGFCLARSWKRDKPPVGMTLETLDDAQPQRVSGAKAALTPDNEALRAMDVAKSSSKAQGFSVRTKLTATPGASKALKKDGKVFLK